MIIFYGKIIKNFFNNLSRYRKTLFDTNTFRNVGQKHCNFHDKLHFRRFSISFSGNLILLPLKFFIELSMSMYLLLSIFPANNNISNNHNVPCTSTFSFLAAILSALSQESNFICLLAAIESSILSYTDN